jgi:branched-subunit amino acid permease
MNKIGAHAEARYQATYTETSSQAGMAGYIRGFGYSAAIISVLSALLVILKEKNGAVMSAMQAATGHHWITHGSVVVVLFVVLGLSLSRMGRHDPEAPAFNGVAILILISTVISGLILAGFFLLG